MVVIESLFDTCRDQIKRGFLIIFLLSGLAAGCQTQTGSLALAGVDQQSTELEEQSPAVDPPATPYPTRPAYNPGELVDYVVQTGDTLPSLAAHFNTTVSEIMEANPIIPETATTLPPGMPMQIPIYYLPLWGTSFQILPDSHFVNGPLQTSFDSQAFLSGQVGWLKNYVEYAAGKNRSAADIIDLVAKNFSISPRLLLALVEYQAGGITQPATPLEGDQYVLDFRDRKYRGLYLQLVWAANSLNNHYYSWRSGDLKSFTHQDGTLERPDPWQNAATVALQVYFSALYSSEQYNLAVNEEGFGQTYATLFGDPWPDVQPHIPGSLNQPDLLLPFEPGETWAYTGGPHTGWGTGPPLAGIDFAPPSVAGGCIPSNEWVAASAAGVVVRSEPGIVVLDLDGDGDERTGWNLFHLHVATNGRVPVGVSLNAGDKVGHPSCEGGTSTGTHVHIARKYNGEWILADGPLAFNLDGWIAHNGSEPYQGTLTRFSSTVTACECSDSASFITAEDRDGDASPLNP
jgi:murein DD-endopeptidase MepM/ murein hydrolase activator NlpD